MQSIVKLGLLLGALGLLSACSSTLVMDDGTRLKCGKIHPVGHVRHGMSYNFFQSWQNGSDDPVYMHRYLVSFQNGYYLDRGGRFVWTDETRSLGFSVPPHTSQRVIVTSTRWKIDGKPEYSDSLKDREYDFMIAYTLEYDFENNTGSKKGHRKDVACQPYLISWFGNGIVESKYETCDPMDENKVGWTNGVCESP